jgi:hypothetical protein
VFEFVVPEMLGKPAATTTDIQNVRVQAAKPGKKCVQPKIPSLVQIKHLIRKDAIADAHSDSQMIGRKVGEFFKHVARYKIDEIEQTFNNGVIGETRR